MTEQKQLHAIIHGAVQGVGFRWWTRQMARRLRLSGYVRNLPDRTVEVVAEGPQKTLHEFLSLLRQGPSSAIVRQVKDTWAPNSGAFVGFEVRF